MCCLEPGLSWAQAGKAYGNRCKVWPHPKAQFLGIVPVLDRNCGSTHPCTPPAPQSTQCQAQPRVCRTAAPEHWKAGPSSVVGHSQPLSTLETCYCHQENTWSSGSSGTKGVPCSFPPPRGKNKEYWYRACRACRQHLGGAGTSTSMLSWALMHSAHKGLRSSRPRGILLQAAGPNRAMVLVEASAFPSLFGQAEALAHRVTFKEKNVCVAGCSEMAGRRFLLLRG